MAIMHDAIGEAVYLAARVAQEAASSAATGVEPSESPTDDGNDKDKSSSPLLFFVALGFGVVFTNLW